ncbi:serine hydroxymethyltransferase [Methanobrevibacter curvatus]|uniref:Serine hydroxymethyltransferase n=1 Tax=Methanobrevibacter curvatus TaxID=49547 RepID=A0A166A5H1_9EURY|nr:serine hydroxymethyltransferase [Methanobrevibacter curvatus]KZX11598.1 serine hydroxymethyltransferase [Methanobrevibacter curvatus]
MSKYQDYVSQLKEISKNQSQWMENSINLIASENITSSAVKEALSSDFSHRYAEGLVGQRLYEGCRYIDEMEKITINLSKEVYNAKYANVQPTSGVVANLAGFFAFSKPGDSLIALEVPKGGHISHSKVSAAGIHGLNVKKHPFDFNTMNIDTDAMIKLIREEKPNIVLLGGSLFLFPHPVKEAKEAADEVGAKVMYDGAHVLGLIAGKTFQDPLKEGADALVGSTHKTFPGTQGGIILSDNLEYEKALNDAVFPGVVSNHHLHHVLGLGIATAEMLEFGHDYASQTIKNAKVLAEELHALGFNVLAEDLGFTESHQVVFDISDIGDASVLAKTFESNNIILNKNLLPYDDVNHSDKPSGIRLGTQEITRRGMKESEMKEVANFIKQVAIDNKNVTDDVTEFMNQYSNVHYAFSDGDAYKYINI